MENRYINILARLTIDQLEREARRVRDINPRKASLVYSELIEKAEDFTDKLYYQGQANRFESLAKPRLQPSEDIASKIRRNTELA